MRNQKNVVANWNCAPRVWGGFKSGLSFKCLDMDLVDVGSETNGSVYSLGSIHI